MCEFYILDPSCYIKIQSRQKSRNFMLVEAGKLEGSSNYIVWAIKLSVILKKEKLCDLVTKLVPSIGLNDGQKDALVNQKAKAVMILTLTIKDNLLKSKE